MAHSASGKKTVVGKLTAVYGVKGWVKVHSFTDPMENIFSYTPWFLVGADESNTGTQVIVDDHRVHGKGLVAHIKGVDDRDAAALFCQQMIAVDIGELPVLPEGEYYWQELTGLQVFSRYGAGERVLLGKVSALMETGANDVLVVSPCEKSVDQRERLLPYVDAYVLEVDLDTGTMLVDWDPEF
ncbi:MAG TPA: ribosome maturation factor RimM [Pseudomonadales bacterium]|nr:ribosome maturation factor RimM [Pseudomonadales bacterium]